MVVLVVLSATSAACSSLTGADDLTIVSDPRLASNDANQGPLDGGQDSSAPATSTDASDSDSDSDAGAVDAAPEHVVTCTSVSAYPSNISELGALASWDNLPTISKADGVYAESSGISTGFSTSPSIVAADMRLAIPSDATIQGVVVTMIRRARDGGDLVDATMRLRWGGASKGDERADPSSWTSSKKTITYGSETDVWGATLTPTVVNGADFGVVFAAKWIVGNAGNDQAYVDSIQMTVNYCH